MNLNPCNQINLYGLSDEFFELSQLYKKNELPSKILLSGQKGIGKCTFAYHLINFILSEDENQKYNITNLSINDESKNYKLIQNGSNPNFTLIDIAPDKKFIDINQIRNLINDLNKSSFNSKPRFVLIDNIEYLNLNSINALLKTLEEPVENTFFILIHNNKKILPTLLSRCLNFKISLSNEKMINISNRLLKYEVHDLINKDLIDYYFTPGKIYNLIKFSDEYDFDLKTMNLEALISLIIKEAYYKKNVLVKNFLYEFIELFLTNKVSVI